MDASERSLDELAGRHSRRHIRRLADDSIDRRRDRASARRGIRASGDACRLSSGAARRHRTGIRARRHGGTSASSNRSAAAHSGSVYRAWDTRLDREVALKLLPADSDVGDARASSIIQEGRLLARVRHPNVVTIYGAERIGDTVGLWMERIDGETVEQRLARESPLQPSERDRDRDPDLPRRFCRPQCRPSAP